MTFSLLYTIFLICIQLPILFHKRQLKNDTLPRIVLGMMFLITLIATNHGCHLMMNAHFFWSLLMLNNASFSLVFWLSIASTVYEATSHLLDVCVYRAGSSPATCTHIKVSCVCLLPKLLARHHSSSGLNRTLRVSHVCLLA